MKTMVLLIAMVLITFSSFSQERQFQKACKKNTVEAFEKFIKKYPVSEYTEEASFNRAVLINTSAEFKSFINKYPSGTFYDKARNTWCKLEYIKIEKSDDIDLFKDFLQKFPDCETYCHYAKKELVRLEFEKVERINTIPAYLDFQNFYPNSIYNEKVCNNIEKLEVESAIASNSIDTVNKYFLKYPNNNSLINFRKKYEEKDFNNTKQSNDINSYQLFLLKYPDGYFKHEAEKSIEQIEYDKIKNTKVKKNYEDYLLKYPNGIYKKEAENCIKDINMFIDVEEENKLSAFEKYIRSFPNGLFIDAAKEKCDWLRTNKAVVVADYPKSINGGSSPYYNVSSPFFKWYVTFKETGGKVGYKIKGQGWYYDNKGDAWGSNSYSGKTTGEITVEPGGKYTYDTWFSGERFVGGYILMNFKGEDDSGNPINLTVRIDCK